MAALFIGRFQPFHLGHLDALKQIFTKEDYVIIVIGSAEDDFTPENPFTAGERYQMIEASLIGEKVCGETITKECFSIIPVRNIHHYSLWVRHLETLLPPFKRVYTNSKIVQQLFLETKKYKVIPLKVNYKISGTEVRKKMLKKESWEKLVPKKTPELIKEWGGVKRIQSL